MVNGASCRGSRKKRQKEHRSSLFSLSNRSQEYSWVCCLLLSHFPRVSIWLDWCVCYEHCGNKACIKRQSSIVPERVSGRTNLSIQKTALSRSRVLQTVLTTHTHEPTDRQTVVRSRIPPVGSLPLVKTSEVIMNQLITLHYREFLPLNCA